MHLSDAVIDFARTQPRLRVSLMLDDVSFRTYDFAEKGLDLALRVSAIRNSSVIARNIAYLDWVVCAPPDYLARAGKPATPADLARHSCLVHVNVAANDRIWAFDGPKGRHSVKVNGSFFSNSALTLRKAALAGLGIALLPRYAVADDIASGALVTLLPRHKVPARPLLAVYPRAVAVPQKVQTFVDFLTAWMAKRDVNHAAGRVPQVPAVA